MSGERLISEFGAQDVGAWLSVFSKGEHVRVASWNNNNGAWDVLPAGHGLLGTSKPVSVEPAEPAEPVEKLGRRARVARPEGLSPSEE